MVGWFIQQQDVGLLKQQTCKSNTRALAAGHLGNQHRELLIGEAQAVQCFVNLVIDGVPARAFDLFFDLHLALHQKVDVRVRLGHQLVNFFHLAMQTVKVLERTRGSMAKRVRWFKPWVLSQVTNARAAGKRQGSKVHLPQTGDQLHQRALAAAVATD